jgi:hypothetical protein
MNSNHVFGHPRERVDAALVETGYEYTDPVTNPHFRRISKYRPEQDDPTWPEGWASDPNYKGPNSVALRAIDLGDYSRDPAHCGWDAGWPTCSNASQLATVTSDQSGTKVVVHKRVAVLVDALLDWTESAKGGNYLLKPAQCGGWNCRAIAGTNPALQPLVGPCRRPQLERQPLHQQRAPHHTHSGGPDVEPFRVGLGRRLLRVDEGLDAPGTPADADEMTALALHELRGQPTKPKWTGDNFMSQGALPPCEVDQNGTTIPKRAYFCATTGRASGLTDRTWLSLATGWDAGDCHVWFVGTKTGPDGNPTPDYLWDFSASLPINERQFWQAPDGTDQIAVEYHSKNPIGWEIEKEPR